VPTPSEPRSPDPDTEQDETETGPLRRCIVTRERNERERMLRFVVGADHQIVPDLQARLPGRGIWLSACRDVLETARVRNAFARAARAPVSVPSGLLAMVEDGLTRRVTELLGLTRRAGQAVFGFARGREWLAGHRAGMIVQAHDGSADERARFLSGLKDVPAAAPLSAEQLGAVFGRDHVVHVVIAPGRLAEALKIETARLAGIAGPRGGVIEAE
jgi:predicted RNA-binding protein YlxR (DUF448 family)